MTLDIQILHQEHVSVAAFCDLVDLFKAFTVDVEVASGPEESFDDFEATSHYYNI